MTWVLNSLEGQILEYSSDLAESVWSVIEQVDMNRIQVYGDSRYRLRQLEASEHQNLAASQPGPVNLRGV